MEIKEILEKEPLLLDIFNEAKAVSHLEWCYKIKIWGKELKPQMTKLVGFWAKNKDLTSCEIYDIVYFHCMDLMRL